MTAAEKIISRLEHIRRVGDGAFRSQCPAHDGKSLDSLSVKDVGDRVLVHCFAGCSIESILKAVGMNSPAELFNDVTRRQKTPGIDPELERRRRIERGLDLWVNMRLTHVCEMLRDMEPLITLLTTILARFENGEAAPQPEVSEQCWRMLARAYKMRTDYEYEFSVLNGADREAKRKLFEQVRA